MALFRVKEESGLFALSGNGFQALGMQDYSVSDHRANVVLVPQVAISAAA